MSVIPSGHHRHGSATEDPSGARLSPSGYVVLEKMRWRTPRWLVKSIAKDLGIDQFDLDAAGEHEAKCAPCVLTMEDDCLTTEWGMVSSPLGTRMIHWPPWPTKCGLAHASGLKTFTVTLAHNLPAHTWSWFFVATSPKKGGLVVREYAGTGAPHRLRITVEGGQLLSRELT